jgi:uncharacterized membrane protein YfcA
MLTDPWFYVVAVPAVIILGLAKGGLSGLGVLALPLMALVISPIQAASIMLPILVVQDSVSIWMFRKTRDSRSLVILLPGAALGIGLGYLLAARVSSAAVELAVGLISIAFALQRLWIEHAGISTPLKDSTWIGVLCGLASGFTSQIAHAGGPPYQIYMMPKQLPRDSFVGTTALFFAAVNWLKVPAYAALGQLTTTNLSTAAALLPLAIGSTIAGSALVRRIPPERFYFASYVLLVALGSKLTWDGARDLFFGG